MLERRKSVTVVETRLETRRDRIWKRALDETLRANGDEWRYVLSLGYKGGAFQPLLEIYRRIVDVEFVLGNLRALRL
jgi:hypothetical protein